MKSLMKKSLAILSVTSVLGAGAAYADAPVPVADPINAIVPISAPIPAPYTIQVNGKAIEETGFMKPAGQEPMLPLRAVTESLGFALTWHPDTYAVELTRGNIYTIVTTGKDTYSINKMLTTLGTAPELVDSRLYVPASFVSKVLHGSVATKGNSISVSLSDEAKKVQSTGVISTIRVDGANAAIHIQGAGLDGIVLNVGADTTYQTLDGKALSLSDLHPGLTVSAEHSMAMTLSLPPQTQATKLTVLDPALHPGTVGTAGTIEDVRDNGSLLIKGSGLTETAPDEVVLHLSEDTAVVNPNGEPVNKAALVKGASVIGFYGPALTKSLPPIGNAWKVVVVPTEE
ncbi:copper amine oxidase N-terminal domain-containing protein [Paenibacillus whitsoniae]|uniref:Copper amine oxidase N-terminal domain-containing protein n=1 Tax=Paenibacillus whitsoniae TaxID=2496558 RepID=A0A430JFW6_9BACL|nr:copper amine oxidase N-terminal domain-containing protein [Paenibacillus whitsoniae]RTE09937.1 copper amine oxidase N-terminal domain-containing protein [Paenibacillus whitsoniae]